MNFKSLGIQFEMNLVGNKSNYDAGIKGMSEVVNIWKYKYLSIFSNIMVIKTFMLPKIIHIASVAPN